MLTARALRALQGEQRGEEPGGAIFPARARLVDILEGDVISSTVVAGLA